MRIAPLLLLLVATPAAPTATFTFRAHPLLPDASCSPLRVAGVDACSAEPVPVPTDASWIRADAGGSPLWMNPRPGGAYGFGPVPCTDWNVWAIPRTRGDRVVHLGHDADEPKTARTTLGQTVEIPVGETVSLTLWVSANCPNAPAEIEFVSPRTDASVEGICRTRLVFLEPGEASVVCSTSSGRVAVTAAE